MEAGHAARGTRAADECAAAGCSYQPDGTRLEVLNTLEGQACDTLRSWTVRVHSSRHHQQVQGYVHAYRLHAEAANRARQQVRARSRKKGHAPKEVTPPVGGVGVRVYNDAS